MSKQASDGLTIKQKPKAYLREWRIFKGMTLLEVAEKMGDCHKSQVSQWETGGRGLSENRLFKYCDAINVSVSEIYTLPGGESVDVLLKDATAEQKAKAYLLVKLLLDKE